MKIYFDVVMKLLTYKNSFYHFHESNFCFIFSSFLFIYFVLQFIFLTLILILGRLLRNGDLADRRRESANR